MRIKRAIEAMIQTQLVARGVADPAVLAAMRAVPRHAFVPDQSLDEAYDDRPLPTEHGQTLSQPYMVARMTELLAVEPGMKVLEIGTGSGYQTAILAHLGASVVSAERHGSLADRARRVLGVLCPGKPITIVVGDGSCGYRAYAPYDRIMVTAGAPRLPDACRDQLEPQGRIVIPVGDRDVQTLTVIERDGDRWHTTADCTCRFVPLVGRAAWEPTDTPGP